MTNPPKKLEPWVKLTTQLIRIFTAGISAADYPLEPQIVMEDRLGCPSYFSSSSIPFSLRADNCDQRRPPPARHRRARGVAGHGPGLGRGLEGGTGSKRFRKIVI